ncbi:hypothetical protein N657DRAFT_626081 [Parathielavia appendiculata]|uniref:MHYT domain-containing protein n=1 Tax=Parathielavia appendiculata TaxID=2587402 RepID=A0AAN6YZE5_9PEZI|nr:hypothetical protein N657DRAFT_626081 [Parathielavia appendiculata]
MDMANRRDLAEHVGQVLPVSFDPVLLVLSYLISLVGAGTTLELIHRRTSRKGYYNNLLLFAAAVTMGGVAIWSMHYIGNRATLLNSGEPELQIAYSVGVTIASFFVPIIVLLVAFFVVTGASTSGNRVSWWRVSIAGTLSGGAICGMHYLGNSSISNYRCTYVVPFVVGSVIIAAVASTVALALFFIFRSSWTNSWWKRVGCAVVMAGAVSGMHWCAVAGTRFTLLHVNATSDLRSRNTTVIVTACLSFAACLIMAGLAIYSARVRKNYANRAQTITLAAAVFDEHGRILVTPDGYLPSEVVTSTFLHKAQNETFSTAHPLFHWLFQASRNWDSISALLDKMYQHLARLPHHGRNMRTAIELVDKEGHIIENYDIIFCELFCVAASALAHQTNEDLVNAGILWDEILATGGHSSTDSIGEAATASRSRGGSVPDIKQDLNDLAEKGARPAKRGGQGHLMFLVRRVDSRHVDHMAASGYCFAEPRHVAHIIRSKMQIRSARLEEKLRGMERYARGTMMEPGVHLGLFAVRTQLQQMGFDILVRKQARNLLPTIEIPLDRLELSHIEFLRKLDGMSLGSLHRQLERTSELPPRDASFARLLLDGIRNLRTSVQDPLFDTAKLVSKVTQVPCTPPINDTRPSTCSLIAFTIMIPIHVRADAPAYEFIPLPFFKTQQLVYNNSPHKAAFARSVHRKISPILESMSSDSTLLPSSRLPDWIKTPGFLYFSSDGRASRTLETQLRRQRTNAVKLTSPSREHMTMTPCDESSVASLTLYGVSGGEADLSPDRKQPSDISVSDIAKVASRRQQPSKISFGGIMISQEVTVDVEEVTTVPASEMPEMPPPTHHHHHHHDGSIGGGGAPGLTRQRSLRGLQSAGDGQNPPRYGDDIELKEVKTVLGVGVSKVEVRKEGDDVATTFVDDLFAICIDTPRRM